MFCIKTRAFIVSGTMWPVSLPPQDNNSYEGETAYVTGYGMTSPGKCVDPLNFYSTDKDLLLYSQFHMDVYEVRQKYVIFKPTVTLLMQFLYVPFAVIAW